MQLPCRLPVTLPAAGVEPAPAACAAVHHYTTLALSPAVLCYKTCNKQHICNATKTICKASMQHCYRCLMQLTNATAILPTSDLVAQMVGVSQQCIAWGERNSHCCELHAAGSSVPACVSSYSQTSWAWVGIQHHLHT